ncbi:MAG: phosphopantetheine adenylyltransferase [Myxococcaceae bacterium]|nr:phosphopantetheine adenylyltransferase [Myxococcaceae bacterium]
MTYVVPALVVVASLVQFPPLAGLSTAALPKLYGIAPPDPTLALLLRHRAVLLGLVGAVLIAGAVHPAWLPLALAVGLTSKLSYLALFALTKERNAHVTRVARVDAVSSALLVVATVVTLA